MMRLLPLQLLIILSIVKVSFPLNIPPDVESMASSMSQALTGSIPTFIGFAEHDTIPVNQGSLQSVAGLEYCLMHSKRNCAIMFVFTKHPSKVLIDDLVKKTNMFSKDFWMLPHTKNLSSLPLRLDSQFYSYEYHGMAGVFTITEHYGVKKVQKSALFATWSQLQGLQLTGSSYFNRRSNLEQTTLVL